MHDPAPPHFIQSQVTILFVEDNIHIHALLRTALQARFKVLSAANSVDAVVLAAENRPIHLLISDLLLPGVSGVEIAAQVKKLHPGAGVMFISGCGSGEIRAKGIDPEQVFVLQKPFSVSDFLTQVESILKPIMAR